MDKLHSNYPRRKRNKKNENGRNINENDTESHKSSCMEWCFKCLCDEYELIHQLIALKVCHVYALKFQATVRAQKKESRCYFCFLLSPDAKSFQWIAEVQSTQAEGNEVLIINRMTTSNSFCFSPHTKLNQTEFFIPSRIGNFKSNESCPELLNAAIFHLLENKRKKDKTLVKANENKKKWYFLLIYHLETSLQKRLNFVLTNKAK